MGNRLQKPREAEQPSDRSRDCSALVLNECREKLKKIKCPQCKKSFCFRCKIPWHAGYRCNESRQLRDVNDILMGRLIEDMEWTRCYNCGHAVERVRGCRSIRCRCGAWFCHECGGRNHLGPCENRCCTCGNAARNWIYAALFLWALFLFVNQIHLLVTSK